MLGNSATFFPSACHTSQQGQTCGLRAACAPQGVSVHPANILAGQSQIVVMLSTNL